MRLWGMYVIGALAVVACGHPAIPSETQTASCIARGPTVTPGAASLHVGDTLRASASLAPCGQPAPSFRWSSSDTAVAVVESGTGLVRARASGRATITAIVVVDETVRGAMVLEVIP